MRLPVGSIAHDPQHFKIKMADVDHWIEIAKECKYLPENDLKVIYSDKNLFIHFQRALSC